MSRLQIGHKLGIEAPKNCKNLKICPKIPKKNLPPTFQGMPFLAVNTLSMDLKQPRLLTLALSPLWFQAITTLF